MKNAMIPESEIKILEEIFDKVEELMENHKNHPLNPEVVMKASDLEHVSIITYIGMLKDFIKDITALRALLEISEEEFLSEITENGKISIEEVKRGLMKSMILDMLG